MCACVCAHVTSFSSVAFICISSCSQLQPNRVPVNLWVKEKKKWSKKPQPAAVLSKTFTLYKASKVCAPVDVHTVFADMVVL